LALSSAIGTPLSSIAERNRGAFLETGQHRELGGIVTARCGAETAKRLLRRTRRSSVARSPCEEKTMDDKISCMKGGRAIFASFPRRTSGRPSSAAFFLNASEVRKAKAQVSTLTG
jgi:hypothetical protein